MGNCGNPACPYQHICGNYFIKDLAIMNKSSALMLKVIAVQHQCCVIERTCGYKIWNKFQVLTCYPVYRSTEHWEKHSILPVAALASKNGTVKHWRNCITHIPGSLINSMASSERVKKFLATMPRTPPVWKRNNTCTSDFLFRTLQSNFDGNKIVWTFHAAHTDICLSMWESTAPLQPSAWVRRRFQCCGRHPALFLYQISSIYSQWIDL